MMKFIIEKESKLLEFLYNNLDVKKKNIKALLVHGNIKVDDVVITKYDYLLTKGVIVKVNFKKTDGLDIIYEDKDIIVVNKKAGLLTVATKKSKDTLYLLVSDYVKKKNSKNKIFIVHRLDRDTSGIVIFAKSEKVKHLFQKKWNEIALKREYTAIVNGIPSDNGVIKSYLKEDQFFNVFSTNSKDGKLAITNYKKIKSKKGKSLLSITIETGRKNQIRVHMKDINCPIIGDKKYGNLKSDRMYLHANLLILKNPITNKKMIFNSPIPEKFNKTMCL